MKRAKYILTFILSIVGFVGCQYGEYDRIPSAAVRIEFGNAAMWSAYGVAAYPDHKEFIKNENKPRGFTYVANSYTGYGGVLLLCDPVNTVRAYDLSCPVERSMKVRVKFDDEELVLRCNECGSTYDISTGSPLSGPAADNRYFLQAYAVYFNPMGGVLITR
ncbi:MAG: hypothetical protein J6U55_02105 [Bacteroidaceae bacterium]|jgi:nitrite reductase/ring-hydroxylating ferredoxin subunit|nr:hypothetical protein [Bacteroidaceae bacterium]MBQ5776188.1 hypothetical protein [Bacteroidaceae bacterium]MBR5003401.1 hypothetical protein [Bacteroidaceae bacterium]